MSIAPPSPPDDLPLFKPLRLPRGVPKEVSEQFERLSLEVAGRGFKRYSSRAVLHRLRWHFVVERNQRLYRINNKWSRPLAIWWMEKHEKPGFFETRERREKADADID